MDITRQRSGARAGVLRQAPKIRSACHRRHAIRSCQLSPSTAKPSLLLSASIRPTINRIRDSPRCRWCAAQPHQPASVGLVLFAGQAYCDELSGFLNGLFNRCSGQVDRFGVTIDVLQPPLTRHLWAAGLGVLIPLEISNDSSEDMPSVWMAGVFLDVKMFSNVPWIGHAPTLPPATAMRDDRFRPAKAFEFPTASEAAVPLWVGALAVTAPLAVCGGSSKRSARITIGDEVPWRPRQIHRHLTRATASILIRPAPSTLLPRLPRRRRTDDQHAPSRYVRFHDGHPSPSQNRTWKLPGADQPRQPSSLSCRQPRPAEARQPATKRFLARARRGSTDGFDPNDRAIAQAIAHGRLSSARLPKSFHPTNPTRDPDHTLRRITSRTLATRVSPLGDSNPRPLPYHGSALPAELRGRLELSVSSCGQLAYAERSRVSI